MQNMGNCHGLMLVVSQHATCLKKDTFFLKFKFWFTLTSEAVIRGCSSK